MTYLQFHALFNLPALLLLLAVTRETLANSPLALDRGYLRHRAPRDDALG